MDFIRDCFEGEEGHVGVALTSILGIGAAVVLALGFVTDEDALGIGGAVLMGLAIVVNAHAPHEWVKRISARLDRDNPSDPDARPETRYRMEF